MQEQRIFIVQFAEEKVTAAVLDNGEAILPEDSTIYSGSGKCHTQTGSPKLGASSSVREIEHRVRMREFLGLMELVNEIRDTEKVDGYMISQGNFDGAIVMAREESLTGNIFFTRNEALANSALLAYQYGKVFGRRAIERVPMNKLIETPVEAVSGVLQPKEEIYTIEDKNYLLWMIFDKGMNEALDEYKYKLRDAVQMSAGIK